MKFKDKVAVVTGGAGGIGRASTLAFAREGAAVSVIDIEEGNSVTEEIRSDGGTSIFLKTDLSSAAGCKMQFRRPHRRSAGLTISPTTPESCSWAPPKKQAKTTGSM